MCGASSTRRGTWSRRADRRLVSRCYGVTREYSFSGLDREMPRRPGKMFTIAIYALTIGGCHETGWDASDLRAPSEAVTRALGDDAFRQLEPEGSHAPDIALPRGLRPCCAFGTDLGVAMEGVAIPLFALANVIGAEDLGPHRFDYGFLSIDRKDRRGWVDNEHNGVVYTCRGGFIDTAHVRDNADLTIALAAAFSRGMDSRFTIDLPPQGAKMRVVGGPVDPGQLGKHGRREIAIQAAQWTSFQLSIWHEIATWYGFAALESWPEKVSAFSPEDLYSNLLGTKIAGGIVRAGGGNSHDEYQNGVDVWLQRVLERLEALPREKGVEATRSVDGIWWDSRKRLPDWELVSRRYMTFGTALEPWLVSMATPQPPAPFMGCSDASAPLVLRSPDGFEGSRFDDLLAVEFEVSDELIAAGIPLSRSDSRVVTQRDFPRIASVIRGEMAKTLGEAVDQP